MYARLRYADMGGSRTAPTAMLAGLVLRDATMQCPIAVGVCVIPLGAVRETTAGYVVCRPGIVRCHCV